MTMRFDNIGNGVEALNGSCVIHRMPVAPGTSIKSQTHNMTYRSDLFTLANMNPVLLSFYTFYCPYRLVWEDWMSFIAQDDDFAGTFPTTNIDWSEVLDADVSNNPNNVASALPRRAFKLFYDQYLGDADWGKAYGENNAAGWTDNVNTNLELRSADQFLSRLRDGDDIDVPTFDATTVPIDLNQFAYEMARARSQRKAQVSGDKYVDALSRMGVSLDWRVQQAPELLGKSHKIVRPNFVTSTEAATLGENRIRFYGTCSHQITRKRFAEEGIVMTVAAVRAIWGNSSYGSALDGTMQEIGDFFTGDDPRVVTPYDGRICSFQVAGTSDVYTRRHARYLDGINYMVSAGNDYFAQQAFANPGAAVYPGQLAGSGEIADEFNFLNEVQTDFNSPVNKAYG